MKNCTILCNPSSGSNNKEKLIKEFKEILKKHDYETNVVYTKYGGHAKKIVAEMENTDLLVSLGGDGTFNEVVTGNLNRKEQLLLIHIPLGTTNDLGAIFGMGKDPIANLKMCLEGKMKKIDICQINNQPFVYVAALGKFTDVPYDTPRKMKKNLGYLAYLINAIKSFNSKTQLFEMEYTYNGETYKGLYSLVLVMNASRMAGIDVFDNVKMDDDQFEVLMTNITSKKDIIKSLYLVKTSDITKVPGFYFFRTNNLKIRLAEEPRKSWCVDGEKFKNKAKDFEISIIKGTKMLLPTRELHKIFLDEKAN